MSKRATGAGEEPAKPAASGEAHSADPGVIAERLQYLFENKRKPDGKKYSYREAIRAIEDAGGASISVGYLSQLVNGVRTNPMMDAIQGLAKFFGVPLSYFDEHEDTVETNEQLKLVAALQHAGVQDVAMRTVGLPPESVKLVLSMIDRVREVEGLPPAESPSSADE
jgi:ESX-1-secreted protein regulator